MSQPVIAEVVRSSFVESQHCGSVIGLDPAGEVALAVGDVDSPVFPRSSNKPLQALAMRRAGLALDGELLALAASSHSGEPFHLDGVRKVLAGVGLDESALQTPPDLPLGEQAARAVLRAGGGPAPITMNCSGKHAAMLATCVVNGWPVETYRSPDHPLQVAVRQTVEELAGEFVAACGVDGCGAPLYALSLSGLARAYRVLALAPPGSHEAAIVGAMRHHPEWVGGTGRDVTLLMRGVPGLVAKDGAEGVYAAALADGRAVAFKVADGATRPRQAVMAAALKRLGVSTAALDELARVPVLGHGEPVGYVRAVLSAEV